MKSRLQNIAVPFLAILVAAGCEKFQSPPPDFSIQQINPDTVRADKPTTLTITGAGLEEVDWVGFGFSKNKKNREEIASVTDIHRINASTIEVLTPELPGIDKKVKVWVSVGHAFEESGPIAVTFRPPNSFDLYALPTAIAIGVCVTLVIVGGFVRRGVRQIVYRRSLLESQGRRLALCDERHARTVLAEIAAEKEAAQLKLEAEYLPYADQASGSDSDK